MSQNLSTKEKYLLAIITTLFILAFLSACTGPRGDAGDKGLPGYSPLVGTMPASLLECPNGGLEIYVETTVTILCNGAPGVKGNTGAPGQDSTPISVFKLCPDIAGVYPSSFPEYGMRINNDVYAIYSANGGFLTLLLPGTYTTTGIGSNCNFTVHNDGRITY